MIEYIVLVIVILLILAYNYNPSSRHRGLPIEGKVVYADTKANRRMFLSYQYRIKSKPDFIVRLKSGDYAVLEYKSRAHGIYQGDIEQLIACSIAVKESFKKKRVVLGIVYNSSGETKEINLDVPVDDLARKINRSLSTARLIHGRKSIRHRPEKRKCYSCGNRNNCQYRV